MPYPQAALLAPFGGGYFPLYSAVQWIASKGLQVHPDSVDEDIWLEAYRSLIDALASQQVEAAGVRQGLRETIPAHAFAFCRFVPFWGGYDDRLASDGEPYLRCGVYADEHQWRRNNDDSIVSGHEPIWRLILVSKQDVARLWPFVTKAQRDSEQPDKKSSIPSELPGVQLCLAFDPHNGLAVVYPICRFDRADSQLLAQLYKQHQEDSASGRLPNNYRCLLADDLALACGIDAQSVRQRASRCRGKFADRYKQKCGHQPAPDVLIQSIPGSIQPSKACDLRRFPILCHRVWRVMSRTRRDKAIVTAEGLLFASQNNFYLRMATYVLLSHLRK